MGYATIQRVPRAIRKYEEAKSIYDKTKPIRGRDNVRPLGARRDVDTYQVRMRDDDVQFMLYKTPVVTYRPDDTIELFCDGWNSMSTRQFISHVLNTHCYTKNGRMILRAGEQLQVMPTKGQEIVLLKEVDGLLTISNPQDVMGYRINRKAANNVRAKYKEFLDYLSNMLLVRKEKSKQGFDTFQFSINEFATVLGTVTSGTEIIEHFVDMHGMDSLANAPRRGWAIRKSKEEAQNGTRKFLGWVSSDQGEDKLDNFYRAMLILAIHARGISRINATPMSTSGLTVNFDRCHSEVQDFLKYADTMLLRIHAKEVLEAHKLKDGVPPNKEYARWMHDAEDLWS